jgi:chromosome segregation ATPase
MAETIIVLQLVALLGITSIALGKHLRVTSLETDLALAQGTLKYTENARDYYRDQLKHAHAAAELDLECKQKSLDGWKSIAVQLEANKAQVYSQLEEQRDQTELARLERDEARDALADASDELASCYAVLSLDANRETAEHAAERLAQGVSARSGVIKVTA